jgi:hypothetical protein
MEHALEVCGSVRSILVLPLDDYRYPTDSADLEHTRLTICLQHITLTNTRHSRHPTSTQLEASIDHGITESVATRASQEQLYPVWIAANHCESGQKRLSPGIHKMRQHCQVVTLGFIANLE